MKIIHGTWILSAEADFIQAGIFFLWVETPITQKNDAKKQQIHPGHLDKNQLITFLTQELGIKTNPVELNQRIFPQYFALPTANNQPLPSPELSKYLETGISEEYEEFAYWQVDCYDIQTVNAIKVISDIHFLALYLSSEIQLGSDLLFWYHYTQTFKQVILKDQYIPALKYRQLEAAGSKKKGKKQTETQTRQLSEIYATWEIISEQYETNIAKYIEYMPLICVGGSATSNKQVEFFDRETLLRHFSESLLNNIVTNTPSTVAFDKQIEDSLIYHCLYQQKCNPLKGNIALNEYQQWLIWKSKITRSQKNSSFNLCFQLQSPPSEDIENWQIQFLVASKQDPSLKLALADYWRMKPKNGDLENVQKRRKSSSSPTSNSQLPSFFDKDFETNLLLNLGYAARMYPKLWQGLETDKPIGLQLSLDEAFDFLKESAWVLEDANFKVIVPAWYTPAGRRRAKVRLKASSGGKSASKNDQKGYFGLDSLVQYEYELAIGDQLVTRSEWEKLVDAKTPLVHFRGQWMELDRDKMQQMLEFWQSHADEKPEMSMLEFLQRSAEAGEDWEIEHDEFLSEMITKLQDKSQLEPICELPNLQGNLREYQKRGVSWLSYLERLGLNGCLADDMGLGKSVQVIARLVQEKDEEEKSQEKKARKGKNLPTLLIAPTSVVGNWQKEIAKFAPHLQAMVHHGSDRITQLADFEAACLQHDVVITSFTLARKDEKLLNSVEWQRLVLDEAQNIKNPKAAQTKAILKISAKHRLALTGTPVENRLLDLWSIFNFLNPGYLGKEAQFRKSFEIPIQKDNDRVKSNTLKKLVEPLILRRVKTDQSIINDLPDKVDQKLYTNLTKEQASLYEAVVKDVEKQLEEAEGIQRKGLILSTLMKLKQICNHPAQFLQDGSEFSSERSHKLSRLVEMVEEAVSEGDSLLVFSQFTEVCESIEKHIKHSLHYNTYYLHGGTNRQRREKMIEEFQNPETEPSIFILSLKAGGVGITLTKANHVFHFDRWWNPAVEEQASDRAFRIGQKKNVFVHKFVAIGTLEEKIDQMIEDKKKLAAAVVGSDESWLTELDNEAFKQLIALNKSAIL